MEFEIAPKATVTSDIGKRLNANYTISPSAEAKPKLDTGENPSDILLNVGDEKYLVSLGPSGLIVLTKVE